jgi:predicted DNA-binding protein
MAEDYAEPSIRMPAELNRRLRIAAAKEDMSRAELIRRVLGEAIGDLEDDGLDAFESGGAAIEAD